MLALFGIFTGLTMVLYMAIFVFCIRKDPDMLRSETYSIQKLAIERGLVGDSTAGIVKLKTIYLGPRLYKRLPAFPSEDPNEAICFCSGPVFSGRAASI